MGTFFTQQPLVVFGATGLLSSDFVFLACVECFSPHIVLQGSNLSRLQGLQDEIEESGFDGIDVTITTDMDTACAYGGYALYARSVRATKQTREEMLLDNAPMAKEVGLSILRNGVSFKRVICVSNPSDLIGLTLLVHSRLSSDVVMSLSALDTLRFRRSLRRRLGVSDASLTNVWTLGSHDQSMALMFDEVRVHGSSLSEKGLLPNDLDAIDREVRYGGINIFKLRGHTAYQSPAILALRMLQSTDEHPFLYPTSRYHHSHRYPFVFGSLPSVITTSGCRHLPVALSRADLSRLDVAFRSISDQRDTLIHYGILPPTHEWPQSLHCHHELVAQYSENTPHTI